MERALATPEAAEIWDELEELAQKTQEPEPVGVAYREVLERDLPRDLMHSIGERAVRFLEEWFEDTAPVVVVLRRILAVDPQAEWAFERLSLMLTMAERWDDLLGEYDRALAIVEDKGKRMALLDEAARIARDFAAQGDRSIGYLKELLPLRPTDAQLALSLERRLEQQERYRDLIDVWQARLGVLSPDDALATRVRMAQTWLGSLHDAEAALEVVDGMIAAGGGEEQACALLEQIGSHQEASFATRRAALGRLREQHGAAGRSAEVARAIELALVVAGDDAERAGLHAEAVRLLGELGRAQDALEHCSRLLVLTPTHEVRQTLRGLVEGTGGYQRFVEALVSAADAAEDAATRVSLLVEAARVCHGPLPAPARAIELYGRVLGDAGLDSAVELDVTRWMTELLVDDVHRAQRLDVLERRAGLEPEPQARKLALGEAAALAEALGDTDRALRLWGRRIDDEPGDMEALNARVELLEKHARWVPLIEALRQRAAASEDRQTQRADLVRIAKVHEVELEDVDKAIDTWTQIDESFGSDHETIDALTALSARVERWDVVVHLLSKDAAAESNPLRRAAQFGQMGDVFRERLGAPGKAVESYSAALATEPTHEAARNGLKALLDDAEGAAAAVEALAKAYGDAGEWQARLELVERRSALAPDELLRRDVLVEAARIAEDRMGNVSRAVGYMRRAFALVPASDTESELRRLAEATGEWGAAADGYRGALERCADPVRERELLFALGKILDERLGDPSGALEAYRRIVESQPGAVEAVCALLRVAGRVGRWDAGVGGFVRSALERQAVEESTVAAFEETASALAGWDDALRALHDAIAAAEHLPAAVAHDLETWLGVWHRDKRGDADAAEAALVRAVGHQAQASTLGMLAQLQRRAPRRELVETLLALAKATGDDLDVLSEAATVAEHSVGDIALARPILERILDVASERWQQQVAAGTASGSAEERCAAGALDRLVAVQLAAGEAKLAMKLLIRGSRMPFSPERSRALRFQAAQVAADRLDDTTRAIKLCDGILAETPEDTSVLALLASLYAREARLADLLEFRRRELALSTQVERRLELRLDIARVLGDLGEPSEGRVAVLRDNLLDSPGHARSIDDLVAILETAGRHDAVVDLLYAQAEQVEARGEASPAAQLWARGARIARQHRQPHERTLQAFRRSAALEPTLEVLDALADIHIERDEHRKAVVWLQQRLDATTRDPDAPEDWRRVVLRVARAYRAAGEAAKARACLVDAIGQDPAAHELRALLAELYEEAEGWAELAPLLAAGADYESDAAAQGALLRRAADVYRRRLSDLPRAIPLLERSVALDPADRGLRLALADALRVAERFEPARVMLGALLEEFGRRRTPERAAVHTQLARIAWAEGNLDEALAQLEAASGITRTEPTILRLLGQVAHQKGDLEGAERAYRALLLIVRRQTVSDDADPNDEGAIAASEVIYELYQLATSQGQEDRARDLLESAFETAAENNFEALRLERLLRAAKRPDLILRVLDARLARITQPDAAVAILVARSDLLAESGKLEEALDSLIDALSKTSKPATLLRSAQDLAVRAGAVSHYVQRLGEVAAVALRDGQPLLACSVWLHLGKIAEETLGDQRLAVDAYDRAQQTGERPMESYRALARLADPQDAALRQRMLRRLVAARKDQVDRELRVDALYELAAADMAVDATVPDAAVMLEQALDVDPRLEQARALVALGLSMVPGCWPLVVLAERIARELGDRPALLQAWVARAQLRDEPLEFLRDALLLAKELQHAPSVDALLERVVTAARGAGAEALAQVTWALVELADAKERAGDAATAVALLREAAAASHPAEAQVLDLRVAALAETALRDLGLAAATYERVLERDPTIEGAWRPLLAIYKELGALDKLEAIIRQSIAVVVDPAARNDLRMELGRRLTSDPARTEQAEELLRDVLDDDPDHIEASVALADLLEQAGRFEELNQLLVRQLDAARDKGDAEGVATLVLRMGRNVEADDPAAAVSLYREYLDAARGSTELLRELLRLCGSDADPTERGELMERLLALVEGEEAAALSLELAELRRRIGDDAGVQRALEAGFRIAPQSEQVCALLEAWYREKGQWRPLAEMISADAEHRAEQEQAVARYREAALIYREQIGDAEQAAEVLRRALEHVPGHIGIVEELCQARLGAGDVEGALGVISETLSALGEGVERAALLERRAAVIAQVDAVSLAVLREAVANLDEAARLSGRELSSSLMPLLERLRVQAEAEGAQPVEREATMRLVALGPSSGDRRRGLELLVGWVKRNPDDADAVRGLGELAAAAEKWGAAAKAYHRLVEITEGADQVDAAIRYAGACEAAGSPMDARPVLEQVHTHGPSDPRLSACLRRMYEAAGAFIELAELLMAEARHVQDEAERFTRLCDAADLASRAEGGADIAMAALRSALELRPGEPTVVARLADALSALGQIDEAVALLDAAIQAQGKKRTVELSRLQHSMARIGRKAGDVDAALAWLDAAIQTDRQNGDAAADLAVLAMEQGNHDLAIKALKIVSLLKDSGPMSRAEAYLRQGIIAHEQGDAKKAVFLAKRALTDDPEYQAAKDFLEQLSG